MSKDAEAELKLEDRWMPVLLLSGASDSCTRPIHIVYITYPSLTVTDVFILDALYVKHVYSIYVAYNVIVYCYLRSRT